MGGQDAARPKRWGAIGLAGKVVLHLAAALVSAGAIIVAAAAWRLSQGPISLAYLTPYLQEAMQFREAGLRISLSDTILTWAGWDRTLDIRAMNARVEDQSGASLIRVPAMSFGLSASSLLRGRIVPTSISIIGLELRVRRTAGGNIDFGLGEAAGDESGQKSDAVLAALLGEIGRAPEADDDPGLSRIRVIDAEFIFDDRMLGRKWYAKEANLVVSRDLGGVRASLDLALELGKQTARIFANGRFDRASLTTGIEIRFVDIEPASLAEQFGSPDWLAAVHLPVSGSIDLGLDSELRLLRMAYDLSAGPGVVDLPEVFAKPMPIESAALRGSVSPSLDSISLESLRLADRDLSIAVSGKIDRVEAGVALDLSGSLRNLPVSRLSHYWPPGLAKHAREWVVGRIDAGRIRQANFRVNVTPKALAGRELPKDAVAVEFSFEGVEADYLPPMTKITRAAGSVQLTAQSFELTLDEAAVDSLRLSEGRLSIPDAFARRPEGEISFVVSGPIAEQVALINSEPLALAGKFGIDPSQLGGVGAARVRLRLPLGDHVDLDSIEVTAAANLRDAALPGLLGRFDVDQGTLTVRADKSGMEVAGSAAVNGVPITLQWIEEFQPKREFGSYFRLTGIVDDAGRAALGLPLEPWLTGPAGAVINLAADPDGRAVADVTLDLRGSALNVEPIAWHKPPGVEATMTFVARIQPDAPFRLERLNLVSAALSAAGEATISRQGELQSLTLERFDFGENHFTATLEARPGGAFAILATGQSLDLRPTLADVFAPVAASADNGPARPFTIDAAIERVLVSDRLSLVNLSGIVRHDGARLVAVDAKGAFADGTGLRVQLTPDSARRRLQITAEDAGTVARAVGVSENIVGGSFRLEGLLMDDKPKRPFEGRIRLKKFRVVRAPVLAKILGFGSLTGIGDLLAGEGIYFKSAEIPFSLVGQQARLGKARASGPALGITVEGTVDFAANASDIAGTIVPSYTLNSVLGVIPLLGKILVPEGEGIFGITYNVSGPLEDPVVDVNPLSALTPGILRRLFFAPVTGNGAQAAGPIIDPKLEDR